VVETSVAALGEPVYHSAAGGPLDGGGAVVGGELVAVGEPAHVAREADEVAGDDGTDAEQVGQGRGGCFDGDAELRSGWTDTPGWRAIFTAVKSGNAPSSNGGASPPSGRSRTRDAAALPVALVEMGDQQIEQAP